MRRGNREQVLAKPNNRRDDHREKREDYNGMAPTKPCALGSGPYGVSAIGCGHLIRIGQISGASQLDWLQFGRCSTGSDLSVLHGLRLSPSFGATLQTLPSQVAEDGLGFGTPSLSFWQNRCLRLQNLTHKRVSTRRFAMFRAITALMLREMATTHGKATGGYVWRLAEPVLGILLFSYIAGLAFRAPSLGISFPIFFAGGWLPYLCFNDIQRQVASSIMQTRYLLTYPAVTLIDAIAARAVLALITQVAIFYLIVSALEFTLTTDTSYRFERIIAGMCMAAALGLGVGIFNCFFWHYFPVWQRIWNILTRPLMLLSGVLFIYEDVPAGYQDLIWWNPLVHITGYVRSGFFTSYEPAWVSFTYVYLFALIPGVIGLFFLLHFYRRILSML